MRIEFVQRDNAPERLACEAEIVFEEGPLAGMKLVGFSLWRSPEGEVYVTFPTRAFGSGQDRRFFDFLRPVEVEQRTAKGVKAWIIDTYHQHAGADADPVEERPSGESLAGRPDPNLAYPR